MTKLNMIQRDDANALIEIAVILPILILMMLCVLDFGVLLEQDTQVNESVRAAAATATVRSYSNSFGAIQAVATAAGAGIPNYSATVTSYCTCAPGSTQFSCGNGSSNYAYCGSYGLPNVYIKVTATATLPLIFKIKGFGASIPVSSTAIARAPWIGSGS